MVKHWKQSLLAVTFAVTLTTGIAQGAVANGDQTYPSLKSMPSPEYPAAAREGKIEGLVLVRALVGVDGRVEEAFLEAGDEIFASAALEAIAQAVFEPAMKEGEPVEVWVSVPFRFELD